MPLIVHMKNTSNSNSSAEKVESNTVNPNDYELPVICDVDILRTLIRKNAARIVDVRKEEEYREGHIPTSYFVTPSACSYQRIPPEGSQWASEIIGVSEKLSPVIVYDDTFGALGARVAWTFQYVGHTNTSLLEVTF